MTVSSPPPIVAPDPAPHWRRQLVSKGDGFRCYRIVKRGKLSNYLVCEILLKPGEAKLL